MPASHAWDQGARPGLPVLSLNGLPVHGSSQQVLEPYIHAEIVDPEGEAIRLAVTPGPLGGSSIKYSLWVLGGILTLLSAAVLVRRPDLPASRWFVLFAGSVALGLAVGPVAGGPQAQWALIMQISSLIGIGVMALPFVMTLVDVRSALPRRAVWLAFVSIGFAIALAYAVAVVAAPTLYELVRPVLFIFVALSLIGSVGWLFFAASRQSQPQGQQSRIALLGIAAGTLPFVLLTLIPDAAGAEPFVPDYITILAVVLMPAAFAYAILRHQMLGIRRLVHRGMVYGITTILLLILAIAGMAVLFDAAQASFVDRYPAAVVAVVLIVGILLFFPLQTGARWLVDRLLYADLADYQSVMDAVHRNVLSRQGAPMLDEIAARIIESMRLESLLVFFEQDVAKAELALAMGTRSAQVSRAIYPLLQDQVQAAGVRTGIADLRWESESLLVANLTVSGRRLGYMLLGPRSGGEVFVEDEKRILATIAPLMALSIEQVLLSRELRDLNQRLITAQESERARIAIDIHDGPLQKAILLVGGRDRIQGDPAVLARELVAELREIGARLRPSILDDLGLPAALEWLLDNLEKRSKLSPRLQVEGVSEDDRFPPECELALFRVAQEATNNTLKHAKAAKVTVSLSKRGQTLQLQVTDDGTGFTAASAGTGGFGLSGMRERVLQLGGSFDVKSAPGAGTTVTARVPLAAGIGGNGRSGG